MNSNIADKHIASKNGDNKNHQAFAMEYSRLKKARNICQVEHNCFEFNTLGGERRFIEIENIVKGERKKDEIKRKTQKDTNPESMYRDDESPTAVSTPKVTKSADHSGGANKNILSNSQALHEEISNIKYLIEYMNNNKNKII
jgi:hypothetical protein